MQSLRIDIHACPSLHELQARERRVLLVQVMPDCLLFVHPFSFVVVDFLSLCLPRGNHSSCTPTGTYVYEQ